MDISDTSSKGCIFEVDLEYPENLHDFHNDYPLAPESLELSEVKKLVPNLNNKTNYVVHYKSLKHYINMVLKLTKIHRVLEFNRSPWMKVYIDLNTDMRKQATNNFDKDSFELRNNSVFGKNYGKYSKLY